MVTVNGKTYKGKYYGPDIFKGNASLNKTYESQIKGKKMTDAAKRALANKIFSSSQKKPTTAAKPATTTATTPKAPSVYPSVNSGNVTSNASGNIQLQTNHDLNMQELEANEAYNAEIDAASAAEQSARIAKASQQLAYSQQRPQDLAQTNARLASRGMNLGGVAGTKNAQLVSQWADQDTAVESQYNQAKTNYDAVVGTNGQPGTAAARKLARLQTIDQGRQDYTNQMSRTSPTQGSLPEDAGVRATSGATPKPATTAKPAAKLAAKPAVKATYKGKYAGPDVFKGNKSMNAAYKKATSGKNLSAAAKRKIAQQIARKG